MNPLVEWVDKVSPTAKDQYPTSWNTQKHLDRAILQTFLSDSLQMEFAELFRDKSFDELEKLARSFHFDQCIQREGLNRIMSDHATVRVLE
jgi:hypothetical protein